MSDAATFTAPNRSYNAAYQQGTVKTRLKPGTETSVEYIIEAARYQPKRAAVLGAVQTPKGWRFTPEQRAAWLRGDGITENEAIKETQIQKFSDALRDVDPAIFLDEARAIKFLHRSGRMIEKERESGKSPDEIVAIFSYLYGDKNIVPTRKDSVDFVLDTMDEIFGGAE
jgi:protein involved in polysaccharide export with SLBB domain